MVWGRCVRCKTAIVGQFVHDNVCDTGQISENLTGLKARILYYNFNWDPTKEKQNTRKHKVAFRRAATVFRDPQQISIYDAEHSANEERWITIGIDSGGILRIVSHTFEQTDADLCEIRIISARKASRAEAL